MEKKRNLSAQRAARFFSVNTNGIAPDDAFEFWRSHFPEVDLAPMPLLDHSHYGAGVIGCEGDDGIGFSETVCAPTKARFTEVDERDMCLALVSGGAIEVTDRGDGRTLFSHASGITLFDAQRARTANSPAGYRAFYISLPRALVHRATGLSSLRGDDPLMRLPDTPLARMIAIDLRAMAQLGPKMDAAASGAAMDSLGLLVRAYLAQCGERFGVNRPMADRSLFAAACRFIDQHRADTRLTVGAVAQALHCSRARLYRLFDRRGVAVAEYIRDVRLNGARQLLRDLSLDIGEVALQSGYEDPSAFTKAFRRRFGMTPRDWRSSLG